MNFFRALASAFVVAVMGAIMLAELGASPQRGGGASSAFIATAANASHRRSGPRLQPYFCGRGDFPDHRHRGADHHGRTAVAHHRAGRAGNARDAAAGAGGVAPPPPRLKLVQNRKGRNSWIANPSRSLSPSSRRCLRHIRRAPRPSSTIGASKTAAAAALKPVTLIAEGNGAPGDGFHRADLHAGAAQALRGLRCRR